MTRNRSKNGTRSPAGGQRRAKKPFGEAVAPVPQGNLDKRGSAVTARAAVDQLLALGFSIQCHADKQPHQSADQKKTTAWVQNTTGVRFARVSQSGYSFYMTSPHGAEITMPAGKTLSFDALRHIEAIARVRLVPDPSVTRHDGKFVFA